MIKTTVSLLGAAGLSAGVLYWFQSPRRRAYAFDRMTRRSGEVWRDPISGRREVMPSHSSPAARALIGAAGGLLAVYGITRRNAWRMIGGVAGSALVARAASKMPFRRLVGAGQGRRAIDIRKTMTIAAPRTRVFEFWSRYVEFPRYTRHILDIRNLGEGRSRWKVLSPAGIQFTWISTLTELRPEKLLAWKTEEGSAVPHTGVLRFMDSHDGGTIIHLHVRYHPPADALGHAAAHGMDRDMESLMEEEFVRIKTFLETESASHGSQRAEQGHS